MARATVAFVLHAHLPWVDPALEDDTLESRWLLDALTDCYLPLLDVLGGLAADRVPVRIVCSLSPTLLAGLAHPSLAARYARHLDRLDALLDAEAVRLRATALADAVSWQRARIARARAAYFERHRGDPIGALRAAAASRVVELWTTAATHAVLPLLSPGWVRTQIDVGLRTFRTHLEREPAGFWLPECAYDPRLDQPLLAAGVGRVVLDTHGLAGGTPPPVYGPHAPIATPSGLVAIARDALGSQQVWSAASGLPGDPWYLDHHADLGWTRSPEELRDFIPVPPGGAPVGIGYHRVTGGDGPKAPYEPERADERVRTHADAFVNRAAWRALELSAQMDRSPLLVYAFDAELFGHWWAEGPAWLDAVLRRLAGHVDLAARTPADDLALHPVIQRVAAVASTWGAGGHLETWLAPETAPLQAAIATRGDELTRLVADGPATAVATPAITAAAHHLLLAQASDWPFMITRDTSAPYARRRLDAHLAAVDRLHDAIRSGARPDRSDLPHDRSFPTLHCRDLSRTLLLS
jgi:1,4-alpha-glucan branching enzyme